MSDKEFQTFEEFWPYYVMEHQKPETQALHAVGTSLGIATMAYAVAKKKPLLIPAALVAGYGGAWFSHFFIEKNRPATFKYPLYSLAGDFKMLGQIVKGTMTEEVQRCRVIEEERLRAIDIKPADED